MGAKRGMPLDQAGARWPWPRTAAVAFSVSFALWALIAVGAAWILR